MLTYYYFLLNSFLYYIYTYRVLLKSIYSNQNFIDIFYTLLRNIHIVSLLLLHYFVTVTSCRGVNRGAEGQKIPFFKYRLKEILMTLFGPCPFIVSKNSLFCRCLATFCIPVQISDILSKHTRLYYVLSNDKKGAE